MRTDSAIIAANNVKLAAVNKDLDAAQKYRVAALTAHSDTLSRASERLVRQLSDTRLSRDSTRILTPTDTERLALKSATLENLKQDIAVNAAQLAAAKQSIVTAQNTVARKRELELTYLTEAWRQLIAVCNH